MMDQIRFNAIVKGMSAAAMKVYAAVPISESWSIHKILTETTRQGAMLDYKIAVGCLDTLCTAGLIKEPTRGEFRRAPIRQPAPKTTTEQPTETPAMTTPTATATLAKQLTPTDKLGHIAASLMVMAQDMNAMFKNMAEQISEAALEVEAELEKESGDIQKLKQLQSLLKSLG